MEKIEKLAQKAAASKNIINVSEINDAFKGEPLTTEQMESIYSYLEDKGIEVTEEIQDNIEPTEKDLSSSDSSADNML